MAKATKRKTAAKKKAAKRTTVAARRKKPARKPAKNAVRAKKKPTAKKKVAARGKVTAKKHGAGRKAPAKRKAAPKKVAPATRAAVAPAPRAAAPMAAAAPAVSPTESPMAGHVKRELTLRRVDASPGVVATVVAVGLGYRKGPASDPGFLPVTLDVDELVAIGLAERLRDGVRPAELDREAHRTTVRSTVNINVDQMGIDANGTVRDTLTSLALGSWRPGLDAHARRNALAGFLVAWYRAGLT